MRVCYFGTFERDYPRNAILIRALRAQGIEVVECHEPLWEKPRDKTGGHARAPSLLRLALALAASYVRLAARHRSVGPHDACLVGYIGQPAVSPARLLHGRRRSPVVFVPMISLYETAVHDRAMFSPRSPLARVLFWLDYASLHLARVLVADTGQERGVLSGGF